MLRMRHLIKFDYPTTTLNYSWVLTRKSHQTPHPYLEADICLDTESKQILQTPSSPLDKDPPLTDLGLIDRDIFASPPPMTLTPPNGTNSNILYRRVPTPIPTFIPPPPLQKNNSLVRPLLLV